MAKRYKVFYKISVICFSKTWYRLDMMHIQLFTIVFLGYTASLTNIVINLSCLFLQRAPIFAVITWVSTPPSWIFITPQANIGTFWRTKPQLSGRSIISSWYGAFFSTNLTGPVDRLFVQDALAFFTGFFPGLSSFIRYWIGFFYNPFYESETSSLIVTFSRTKYELGFDMRRRSQDFLPAYRTFEFFLLV